VEVQKSDACKRRRTVCGIRLLRHSYRQKYILFKYSEGNWKTCAGKIKELVAKEFPNRFSAYSNAEEEYNKFLKSENALLAILTIVSLV
jgi:adenine-specific DNA methylase